MNLSNYILLRVPSIAIVSEEAAARLLEMVRQPARATRVRKLVPELRDLVSRAARCLYTDVFRREDSQTSIPRISLELI